MTRNLPPLTYERVSILEGLDVIESNSEWLWLEWDRAVSSFRPSAHEVPHAHILSAPLSVRDQVTARMAVGEGA